MEANDGSPSGYGRGRPGENTELRRPHVYNAYTPEYMPADGTNGMYPEPAWQNTSGDLNYMASPSNDHARLQPSHSGGEPAVKTSQLSPYAVEFVPRNFRPEPRVLANEMPEPPVDRLPDPYPVQKLRSFLSEITMNPGKFERMISALTETLNNMVDDDDTMRAIVNIIFDESVRQPNLRYSGARLCKTLCNDLDASPDRLNFRSVLLTRCNQEFKRREVLAQAEDMGNYMRGFAFFMAELFSQLEVQKQRIAVLGDSLPNLIKTIIQFSSPDNLKCACQILKLVGAFLEDYERGKNPNGSSAPEMDSIVLTLKNLGSSPDFTRNICDLINSVVKLRESDWGRSSHTENSGYETCPPSSVDEPVMYGPDGKPMTADELMFLQSQYSNSNQTDPDDYESYEENYVDNNMDEEISEAYEVFLREQQMRGLSSDN